MRRNIVSTRTIFAKNSIGQKKEEVWREIYEHLWYAHRPTV